MSIDLVRGSSDKPTTSRLLIEAVEGKNSLSGCLFVGYPIMATAEGRRCVDAVMVSPKSGIIVFDLVESEVAGDYATRQDDCANLIEARLRVHRELLSGRDLRIPIHTITFAPASASIRAGDHVLCRDGDDLVGELAQLDWSTACDDVYRDALSALENVAGIRSLRTRRVPASTTSRGAEYAALGTSTVVLDHEQNRAVIETVEGIQCIRGPAGTGKTVVLALKAAYLHARYRTWRIAVICHARSLRDVFRSHIERAHIRHANEPPNWDLVRVVGAWASGWNDHPGLYEEYCREAGLRSMSLEKSWERFGRDGALAGACQEALGRGGSTPIYDAILVDEAQEFPMEFFQVCRALLKKPRHLVCTYDDLTNLEPSPPVERLGRVFDGGCQNLVLEKSYGSPPTVITTAHALQLGIYRTPPKAAATGLTQMFDDPECWERLGYQVKEGELGYGEEVTLARRPDAIPVFFEKNSPRSNPIDCKVFETYTEQTSWLVDEIKRNLDEDEFSCRDVLVVYPDPSTIRVRSAQARAMLFEYEIAPYLAGVDPNGDVYWPDGDAVVFCSVDQARGREAAMVYVVDAQDYQSQGNDLARRRNRLYLAITRSRGWVRILGVGPAMIELAAECRRVAEEGYQLRFRYPDTNDHSFR